MTYKHSCETLKWRNEKGSYFKLVNIYDGWWELTIVLNENIKVAIHINFCPFCGVKLE